MKPAYIENNLVMQLAFRDFVMFAWEDKKMRAEFERETGMKRTPAPTSPLEVMVDEATGVHSEYANAFFAWAVKQWGDEDDPEYQAAVAAGLESDDV